MLGLDMPRSAAAVYVLARCGDCTFSVYGSFVWAQREIVLHHRAGHTPIEESTPIYDRLATRDATPICGARNPEPGPDAGSPCMHRGSHALDRNGNVFHVTESLYWWTEHRGVPEPTGA